MLNHVLCRGIKLPESCFRSFHSIELEKKQFASQVRVSSVDLAQEFKSVSPGVKNSER